MFTTPDKALQTLPHSTPQRIGQPVSAAREEKNRVRLLSSVHDLVGEAPSVEVGHEAADLVALELEYAHAVVGNRIPVRGALSRPLERRPVLGDDEVAEHRLHLAEGPAVLLPELPKAIVAVERLRDRDVAHLTVLGVDPDEGLDVLFFLQLPQRLDEAVCYLSGHGMTFRAYTVRG